MGFRLKIVIIVLGIGLVGWSAEERKLASLCKAAAASVSCARLGDKGVSDNAHVELTDFILAPNLVYSKDKNSERWDQIWVPAVPVDSPYVQQLATAVAAGKKIEDTPMPKPVHVIVTTKDVGDQAAFDAFGDKEQLEGLVINAISKIDGDTKRLLEETYGDVSHAQILEVGRKPANLALSYLGIVGGVLIALFGVFLFIPRRKLTAAVPKAA